MKNICCICGKEIEGYGNNPWPVTKKQTDKCCDNCNITKVIPARMTHYERTKTQVYATGNKWAIENFEATHN